LKRQELIEKSLRTVLSSMAPWAPGVTAAAAEKLFFRAWQYPMPERERLLLATGHRLSFDVPGERGTARLACWSWGDGPSVFLLHGWSGRAGQLGAFVEPLVNAGYSVMAFDAPAHGQSTGSTTSAPTFARALDAVIRRFGPAHAVIGHSMGGWAAAFALLQGARIERLALIGSPTDPTAFTESFSERFGLTPEVTDRMMARAERRLGLKRAEFELTPRIGAAGARALIIHDESDAEVPFSNAQAWAAAWPGSELVKTQGLGHYKPLRDPDVIARTIKFVTAG
jgi:pimeloyl-ACP methyl ester carboxylesterase